MQGHDYSISFTTCSIRPLESLKVARQYRDIRNWNEVRSSVLDNNLLQQRTVNGAKRLYREISSRLRCLVISEINLLIDGTTMERNQMLWLAVCRRYDFIADFSREVLADHVMRLDYNLSYEHFDSFWNSKAIIDPHLQTVAASTKSKGRQVLFKMLSEVNLIDNQNQLLIWSYSDDFIRIISSASVEEFDIYPNLRRFHGEKL